MRWRRHTSRVSHTANYRMIIYEQCNCEHVPLSDEDSDLIIIHARACIVHIYLYKYIYCVHIYTHVHVLYMSHLEGMQKRLDTFITLHNVNTIFADAAIYPPLKMYGSFEMHLGAKSSEGGRRLVASYTYLSLHTQKIFLGSYGVKY